MVYLWPLRKKTLVVRAVVATWVPEPPIWTSMIEVLDKAQGLQGKTKADHETKAGKLFEELDLSGLESWLPHSWLWACCS